MDELKIEMPDSYTWPNITGFNIRVPLLSPWRCYLFGADRDGIVWRPVMGSEPNWFWRWMQYLCFGNRWVREPDDSPGH